MRDDSRRKQSNHKTMNGTSIGFFVALLGLTDPVLAGAEPIVIDQAPPELRDVTSRLWTVVFSPNGKTLAVTAGWDNPREPGELVLWDVATRQTKLIWRQEATIRTAAFSGDGKLLAIGDFAGAARLLDPSTGKIILTFPKHSKLVNSVAFTPDDKTLVTGSFDQTIKLWDVASGKEQHVNSTRRIAPAAGEPGRPWKDTDRRGRRVCARREESCYWELGYYSEALGYRERQAPSGPGRTQRTCPERSDLAGRQNFGVGRRRR